jgi:hypothetical protein
VCDLWANQDLYGLGPGGYPTGEVPEGHPSCICAVSAIADDEHFNRELAKAKGEPEPPKAWESGQVVTGDQWLRSLSDAQRVAVAGPTRAKLVMQGRSVMSGPSKFTPVYQLLGQAKPEPRRVMVEATKLVAGDRATMVRPFPELPGRAAARKSSRPPLAQVKPVPSVLPERRPPPKAITDKVKGALDAQNSDLLESAVRDIRADLAGRYGFREPMDVERIWVAGEDDPNFHLAHGAFHPDKKTLWVGKNARVKTAIHETIHSMGGPSSMKAASGATRNFEESATEAITQHYMGAGEYVKLVKPDTTKPLLERVGDVEGAIDGAAKAIPGSYSRWRSRVHLAIAHANDAWDGATVQRAFEEAAVVWKRKRYATSDEAYGAFVDALKPKDATVRAFYDRVFKTKWGGGGL